MALEWPDFTQACATDEAPYRFLVDALAERYAAASAATGRGIGFPVSSDSTRPAPLLSRLESLRENLRSIAPSFVRLEDPSYRLRSWSGFPAAYSGTDLMKGEHSLALLPAPGSPERDPEALRIYRDFLGNCAWWLGRFRYVDVSERSYYTRRSKASGEIDIGDSEYWGHSESGVEPADAMRSPTHEAVAESAASSDLAIRCVHVSNDRYDDFFDSETGTWRQDVERHQHRSVSATAYSGLVVRNFSGLAGTLVLMPCFDRIGSRRSHPERSVSVDRITSLIDTFPTHPNGDKFAGDYNTVETEEERHGDRWLETYRRAVDCRQWNKVVDDSTWRVMHEGTETETTTVWSLDGSRSHSETESSEDTGTNYTVWENTETRIEDFDGFGEWTEGAPVERGAVPAHGRVVAIPERSSIPLPDLWDLEPLRKWRHGVHPRYVSDGVAVTTLLRIVPVLDFNASYQHQES